MLDWESEKGFEERGVGTDALPVELKKSLFLGTSYPLTRAAGTLV